MLLLKCRNALTTREIQTITKVSKSSVSNYIKTYMELDSSLDEVLAFDDEALEALFFVSVLGMSGCTFVHATHSQSTKDFILSHTLAFIFYGGVSWWLWQRGRDSIPR